MIAKEEVLRHGGVIPFEDVDVHVTSRSTVTTMSMMGLAASPGTEGEPMCSIPTDPDVNASSIR